MFIRAPYLTVTDSQDKEPQTEGFAVRGWSHHGQLILVNKLGNAEWREDEGKPPR